jgi:tellurite resistance protein
MNKPNKKAGVDKPLSRTSFPAKKKTVKKKTVKKKFVRRKVKKKVAKKKTKIVSYDFLIDNIIAVKAPVGTDPDTLIDQALEQLIQRCHQHGEISFIFDKVFDPEAD